MRDPDRLDLTRLDPSRDGRRWEALLQRTIAASQPPSTSLWPELMRFRWGVLAAAAVAVLAWVPSLRAQEDVVGMKSTPALALMNVHHGGDVVSFLESVDGP